MPRRTYLSNRAQQRRCRLNGIQLSYRLRSKTKLQKKSQDHVHFTNSQLPHKVDLRSTMTPVEGQ